MDRSCLNVALYTRALLGSRRLDEAQKYLERIGNASFRIPVANSSVLLGLYEGGYDAECISFYRDLEAINPEMKLLSDPRGFFAPILCAYHLKDYQTVLSIFSHVQKNDYYPSREVVYILTEIYAKGDFWKSEYEKRLKQAQEKGINITEKLQLQILAQCRLDQFLKGGKVIGDFCKRNKESQIVIDHRKNLAIKVHTYGDTQRRLRLVDALTEVGEVYTKPELACNFLVVKTLEKDRVLGDLLKRELYPTIFFFEHVEIDSISDA